MFIAGRISNHSLVEILGQSSNMPDEWFPKIKSALAANYGGSESDFYIYTITDNSEIAGRILKGDTFTLIWTNDAITSLDFSSEDAKLWLQISADKNSFIADSMETILIIASILKADKSGIDTTFSENVDIPFSTPEGIKKYRFYFVSGVSSKLIKSDMAGKWDVPSELYRIGLLRVDTHISFESILQ